MKVEPFPARRIHLGLPGAGHIFRSKLQGKAFAQVERIESWRQLVDRKRGISRIRAQGVTELLRERKLGDHLVRGASEIGHPLARRVIVNWFERLGPVFHHWVAGTVVVRFDGNVGVNQGAAAHATGGENVNLRKNVVPVERLALEFVREKAMDTVGQLAQPMRLQIGASHGQESEQALAMVWAWPVLNGLLRICDVLRYGSFWCEVPQPTLKH